MAHTQDELTAFQNGEQRIIYARNRTTGALYLLPDGEGGSSKAFTKEHLRCPIPECVSPDLTSAGRSTRRDGFVHLKTGAGGHAPERLFHLQAAEMLARWLRAAYPRSTVAKEEASNAARERVADVMITAATGQRMAFEVQYSAITVDYWATRHASYLAQGIPDVWLFGHTGEHLRTRSGQVQLGALHQMIAERDLVVFVNPIAEQLATVVREAHLAGGRTVLVPARHGRGQLLIAALADFKITGSRFTCSRFEQLLVDEASMLAERKAEVARQAAETAAWARDHAARAARPKPAAVEQVSAYRRSYAQVEKDWAASADRRQLLARLGGRWPSFIGQELHDELPVPAELWQATVFRYLILDRGAGEQVLIKDSLQLIGVSASPEHVRVFREWLDGLVGVRRSATGGG